MEAEWGSLPFDAAIKFFRQKVSVPTSRWNDLWQGMHARGFMVAGAAKEELLNDLRAAVDSAIADGTTIRAFRKKFDDLVARHGWVYKGGRNWRTRVIFDTNVRTAYAAGRYQQMTDPGVLQSRPYWEYRHGDSVVPRPQHVSWDGLVLAADDPWWHAHYPPNGWGCKCRVFSLSLRDLKALGKVDPDKAPDDGFYTWTDKKTGARHRVPVGIDPGWDYNVGTAAWGRTQALKLMEDAGPWKTLDPRGPAKYGRPRIIPVDAARAQLGRPVPVGNEKALRAALRRAIGGDEVLLTDPAGGKVMITQAIVDHILAKSRARWDGREAYFTLIPELIADPYEIWISFARSEMSHRVAVRRKYVKFVRLSKGRVLGLWAEFMQGQWVSRDLFRGGKTAVNNLRKGRLVYGRK